MAQSSPGCFSLEFLALLFPLIDYFFLLALIHKRFVVHFLRQGLPIVSLGSLRGRALLYRQQLIDQGLRLLILVAFRFLSSDPRRTHFLQEFECGGQLVIFFLVDCCGRRLEHASFAVGLCGQGVRGGIGGVGQALDAVGNALVLGHLIEIHGSKYRKYNADSPIIFRFQGMSTKFDEELSLATHKKHTIKFKIVFIGDQAVGKSSIINRFIKDEFDTTHNPTVGIDFVSKNVNIKDHCIRLQLWDTAGQERFKSLIPGYLRDSHAIFLVYDVTNSESFVNINTWVDYVKEHRGEDVIMFIVGNKTDLAEERTVSPEGVEEKYKQIGAHFIEVSAKTGQNLQKLFTDACGQLLKSSDLETTVSHINHSKDKKQLNKITGEKQKPIKKQTAAQVKPTQKIDLKNQKPMRGSKLLKEDGGRNLKIVKEKNCC